MSTWREARSFLAVVAMVGVVATTTITSCGGGGEGSSNGDLCEQCGDTDGPCNAAGATVSGDDRPTGCGTDDPCTVQLQCVRKVDSGQRRCFPVDPSTGSLDFFYKCDGSRPALVPTSTPVPSPTLTPSPTVTPTDTGPTATGPTPSAPTPTATPAGEETVDVDIEIATSDDSDLPSSFSAQITYPPAKGSFVSEGTEDCDGDEGFSAQDDGNGTLTLQFSGDTEDTSFASIICVFHQATGQTLEDADLGKSVAPPLVITIGEL